MRWPLVVLAACCTGLSAEPPGARTTPFWDHVWPSDLAGAFEGTVLLAQSQVMPSVHRIEGDVQPHPTAERRTLVLLQPRRDVDTTGGILLNVSVGNVRSHTLRMLPPAHAPRHVPWPGAGADSAELGPPVSSVPFHQHPDSPAGGEALCAAGLRDELVRHRNVTVTIGDGGVAVERIPLPRGEGGDADLLDAAKLVVRNERASSVAVVYPAAAGAFDRRQQVAPGETVVFTHVGGQWVDARDVGHAGYTYARRLWSAVVPGEYIARGLRMEFAIGDRRSVLPDVHVGPPTRVVLNAIDVGLLDAPPARSFASDAALHREYYEAVPVSRATIVQYAPLVLAEADVPAWLPAPGPAAATPAAAIDIGERLATLAALVAAGITHANYGVSSSPLPAHDAGIPLPPAPAAQATVVQLHALVVPPPAGPGAVVVTDADGATVARGLGEHFGLPDPLDMDLGGAGDGDVGVVFNPFLHRPGTSRGSTWGWHSAKNVFLPNFRPGASNRTVCCCSPRFDCVAPFAGFPFNLDPMAGGSAAYAEVSRIPLHNPAAAHALQARLEASVTPSAASPTGFVRYNATAMRTHPVPNPYSTSRTPQRRGVPVTTVCGYFDPSAAVSDAILPVLHGASGSVYPPDASSPPGGADMPPPQVPAADCVLRVHTALAVRDHGLSATPPLPEAGTTAMQFHVHVATADAPRLAQLFCGTTLRASRTLAPPPASAAMLTTTVNGMPTPPADIQPLPDRPLPSGFVDATLPFAPLEDESADSPAGADSPLLLILSIGFVGALVVVGAASFAIAQMRYRGGGAAAAADFSITLDEAIARKNAKDAKRSPRARTAANPLHSAGSDADSPLLGGTATALPSPLGSAEATVTNHSLTAPQDDTLRGDAMRDTKGQANAAGLPSPALDLTIIDRDNELSLLVSPPVSPKRNSLGTQDKSPSLLVAHGSTLTSPDKSPLAIRRRLHSPLLVSCASPRHGGLLTPLSRSPVRDIPSPGSLSKPPPLPVARKAHPSPDAGEAL